MKNINYIISSSTKGSFSTVIKSQIDDGDKLKSYHDSGAQIKSRLYWKLYEFFRKSLVLTLDY
jgi:hypothetical protein